MNIFLYLIVLLLFAFVLMRELDNELMANALVVVDQLSAACAESGEVIAALNANCLVKDTILELGAVITNGRPVHSSARSIFKSVGLAIQDISIAKAVYHNAVQKGLGRSVRLV